MSEKVYYFIQPLDAHTNKVVCEYLEVGEGDEAIQTIVGPDGKELQVIQCARHAQLTYLLGSMNEKNLQFKSWGRKGAKGKVYPWPYTSSPRRKRKKTAQPAVS